MVVLCFPNQTMLPQHAKPMADNLAAALGGETSVIPLVGCGMVSVIRGMLPNG